MRWIVGDIHGCAWELERLLRTIEFDETRDELWSVGDLVNTGPDSLAVLRLWRELGGRGVLGNHDIYALAAHGGARSRRPDTLDALFAAPDADELLGWLRRFPVLSYLAPPSAGGSAAWLVHAGLRPDWSDLPAVADRLNAEPHDDTWLLSPWVSFATRVRCCSAAGEMVRHVGPPAGCPQGFLPWDSYYGGVAPVVHGHWAQRGFYRGARTLGLDSGCVYGGALTAWCVDDDRVLRVSARG